MSKALLLRAAPALFGASFLVLWEAAVRLAQVPVYIVPGPIAIAGALVSGYATLLESLVSTLAVTFMALAVSCVLGVGMAMAMALSRWARAAIQPWAVILQVTPVVAIAPLIIVWVGDPFASLVVCATIVAFFPVFSNTEAGLTSVAPELLDLFRLNGAGRWATLRLLRLPAALPYFLAGLRISGGLALVGAVVAEFVAGSGGFASGLAYRILEAGYRLQIARMFAAGALRGLGSLPGQQEQAARAGHKSAAGGGQLDGPAAAVEECGAEGAFESLDLPAERRLRDAQAPRGASEVQFIGHRREIPALLQIEPGRHAVKVRRVPAHASSVPQPRVLCCGLTRLFPIRCGSVSRWPGP